MDERNVRRLERVLQEDRTSTVLDITNSFNNVSTVNVCKRTIQRVLHANGLRKRSIRKKWGSDGITGCDVFIGVETD